MFKQIMGVLLLMSVSFAWNIQPPSCLTQYSILGFNFSLTTKGQAIGCIADNRLAYGILLEGGNGYGTTVVGTANGITITDSGAQENIHINLPTSGNATIISSAAHTFTNDAGSGSGSCSYANLTDLNSTTYQLQCGGLINFTKGSSQRIQVGGVVGANVVNISNFNYSSSVLESNFYEYGVGNHFQNISAYNTYTSSFGNNILRSDFTTGMKVGTTTGYCRVLLYFNNPYYGNIQLIPKITYIPGVDAIHNFFNTSDNSAYIPNNTISYIYDSVTSGWFIVPAYICSSYSIVGSTSVLQYNATAGSYAYGTSPAQLSMTGACSYTNSTRTISCTASDATNTLTSMTLQAFNFGNQTPTCNTTGAGSSSTLNCILPNVSNTYEYVLFGTDGYGFNYILSSDSISALETAETTNYGRNGWLAMLIIFGTIALLMSINLAISMAFGCFALFVGMALGIIPATGNVGIVVLLCVVGFAIAYRLKI